MDLDLTLYVVLDPHLMGGRSLLDVARAALRGGATVLQFRDKDASTGELVAAAEALAALARAAGARFIMNDHVGIAAAVGGGVHLGPDDLAVSAARAAGSGCAHRFLRRHARGGAGRRVGRGRLPGHGSRLRHVVESGRRDPYWRRRTGACDSRDQVARRGDRGDRARSRRPLYRGGRGGRGGDHGRHLGGGRRGRRAPYATRWRRREEGGAGALPRLPAATMKEDGAINDD